MSRIPKKNLQKGVPFLAIAAFMVLMLCIRVTRAFFVGVFGWAIVFYVAVMLAVGVALLFGVKIRMPLKRTALFTALLILLLCTLHVLFARTMMSGGNYLLDPYRGYDTVGGVIFSALTAPFKLLFRNNYTALLLFYFLVTALLGLIALYPLLLTLDGGGQDPRAKQRGRRRLHTEKVAPSSRYEEEKSGENTPFYRNPFGTSNDDITIGRSSAPTAEGAKKAGKSYFEETEQKSAADILFGNAPISPKKKSDWYDPEEESTLSALDTYDVSDPMQLSTYTNQGRARQVKHNLELQQQRRMSEEELRERFPDYDAPSAETPKSPETDYSYFLSKDDDSQCATSDAPAPSVEEGAQTTQPLPGTFDAPKGYDAPYSPPNPPEQPPSPPVQTPGPQAQYVYGLEFMGTDPVTGVRSPYAPPLGAQPPQSPLPPPAPAYGGGYGYPPYFPSGNPYADQYSGAHMPSRYSAPPASPAPQDPIPVRVMPQQGEGNQSGKITDPLMYILTPVPAEEYAQHYSKLLAEDDPSHLHTKPVAKSPVKPDATPLPEQETDKKEGGLYTDPVAPKVKPEPKPEEKSGEETEANKGYGTPKEEETEPDQQESTNKAKEEPRESAEAEVKETPNGVRIKMKKPEPEEEPEAQEEPEPEEEEYVPTPYNAPPLELLKQYPVSGGDFPEDYAQKKVEIERTLAEFRVPAEVVGAKRGPAFTRYELKVGEGYRVSGLDTLQDNLKMRLRAKSIRILSPIAGEDKAGIEVPNEKSDIVGIRSVLCSKEFNLSNKGVQIAFGKTLDGTNYVTDLAKLPHLLVAGATGTGKSVFINSLILSILYKYSPEDVRLLMIDPKRVELSAYNNIPHMLIPSAVKEHQQAVNLLKWLTEEMDRRYAFLETMGCNKIDQYNEEIVPASEKPIPKMSRIVLIIDEMADLMIKGKGDVEDYIVRLAQLARAAGIHMVLATQRPTKNVITGLIKGNILARVGFQVQSQIDSRVIFDQSGAETLLGNGDMLFSYKSELTRIQGALTENSEVRATCEYIRAHNPAKFDETARKYIMSEKEEPVQDVSRDKQEARQEMMEKDFEDKLRDILRWFIQVKRASVSSAQARFGVGYIKAKKLVDEMTRRKYLSAEDGAKPREILITMEEFEEIYGEDSGTGGE